MSPEEKTRVQDVAASDETADHLAGAASSTRVQSDEEKKRSRQRTALQTLNVPGYELAEQIGVGGMGVVYKATHVRFNRTVALKMILGGQAVDERELRRFLVEVEAVAAIDHPNVVKVFDTGDTGGRPYLAMEYLPGGNLAQSLKQNGRLEPEAAANLVRKLALGMQAAHEHQIVHRDLKPANVLFGAAGEPRVTDFGLAKKSGTGELTGTGAIMGTPAYMAPEQAKGESKFVGPQADVWALGVILYECLTGARPFGGSNEIEIIRNVVEAEPSSVRACY